MQMLVVFTGKTFGLQVVELSKPFVIRKVKLCLEVCKLQNFAKRVTTAPIKLVTVPVKIVQNAVHAVADTLHPGQQEEECVLTYVLTFEIHCMSGRNATFWGIDLWARL